MGAAAKGLMRVTNHPRNDEWLILKFGPELNTIIGTFGPAQQALDLGGYVMHRDQLDALRTWCGYQSVTLFVEARSGGEPTQAVECGNTLEDGTNCAAPYRASAIPKFCGACGQAANPVTFQGGEPLVGIKCPGCGRINHGGPAYCTACGLPLPEHHLRASPFRRKLEDPVPIGDVIAEMQEGA